MQAQDASIAFLREGAIYKVPFFQRKYVWDEENWNGLWETLSLSVDDRNIFIGSIIRKSLNIDGGKVVYSVIDGQQRITTLSILIKAILDYENFEENDYEFYVILKNYLYNGQNIIEEGRRTTKYTLKLSNSKNDISDYTSVMNGVYKNNLTINENDSNIIKCYKYFRAKLETTNHGPTLDNIISNLTYDTRKSLVIITLEDEDNEQSIFDTINSSGVRLTSSDIIKNNLFDKLGELMDRNVPLLESFFNSTWGNVFEENKPTTDRWLEKKSVGRIERTNLELFLQAYATMNPVLFDPTLAGVRLEDLPKYYSSYVSNFNLSELEEFINDLCEKAKVYREYFIEKKELISNYGIQFKDTAASEKDNLMNHILQIFGYLNSFVFEPYVLKIITDDGADVITKLTNLEKFIMRHLIVKQGMDKNYNNIVPQMLKNSGTYSPENYLADDEHSNTALEESLLYISKSKHQFAKLVLYWVELKKEYDNEADTQTLLVTQSSHQLEHIMPQAYEDNWPITIPTLDKNGNPLLPEDAAKIEVDLKTKRKQSIYCFGNMTLLRGPKNAQLSNASFDNKKNGFIDANGNKIEGYNTASNFMITNDVRILDEWDEDSIKQRFDSLLNIVTNLW